MLPATLIFAAALLFVFCIIYCAWEIIVDARPERRTAKVIQFGGLALVYACMSIADVPSAMTILSNGTTASQVDAPIIKTLVITAFLVNQTMVYARRSDRLNDKMLHTSQVVGTTMLMAGASILVGLVLALLTEGKLVDMAYVTSNDAAWAGTVAVFILSFVAVYCSVYAVINKMPFRWLGFAALVVYFVLFAAAPPDMVNKAISGRGVTLLEAVRPYGLAISMLISVASMVIRMDNQSVTNARLRSAKLSENQKDT
jgi:hypothetical protein